MGCRSPFQPPFLPVVARWRPTNLTFWEIAQDYPNGLMIVEGQSGDNSQLDLVADPDE
jgi:hypothetical protein